MDDVAKEKIKIALTGKKHSEETKRKMSEARTGVPKNFSEQGKLNIKLAANARKGKKKNTIVSEATRIKIGNNSRNRSPESNKRIGDAVRNRSPEVKARILASRPPITDETRAKLAKAGRERAPEIAERFTKSNTGIKRSYETCVRLSLTHVGKTLDPLSILKRELTRQGGNGKVYSKEEIK